MKKYIFLFLGIVSLAASCKKDEDDPTDTQKPTINWVSPQNHDTIGDGDTVHYKVIITDNESLQNISFALKLIDGTSLIDINRTFSEVTTSYTIDTNYVVSAGFAQINHRVEATDKNNNTATLSGHVHEVH